MEEDAGKLIHQKKGTSSFVDCNRCGTPLLEIVSEPDINSPDEAYLYLATLKALLKYLEVSDCDMEKGSLRCDANISIRPKGSAKLGTKVELKNMNSFKGVKAALEFEQARQKDVLEEAQQIVQETRLWNEDKRITEPMRTKEMAHDYRYFPEPDLPIFVIKPEWIDEQKDALPEMPNQRKKAFMERYNLSETDALIIVSDKAIADYFEECLKLYKNPKNIVNWIASEILKYLNAADLEFSDITVKPQYFVDMLKMLDEGIISSKMAKDLIKELIESDKSAQDIIKEKRLVQISDESELDKIIEDVIGQNPKPVQDYKKGKKEACTFLVGQVMAATKGKANPGMVNKILQEKLKRGSW